MESGFPSILLHVIAPFNVHVYLGLCKWLVFFASTNVHLAVSSSFIFKSNKTLFLSFDSNQYSYEEKRKHTRSHSQRKIFTLQMIYVMFSSSSLKTTAHFMYWHRSIIRFEHRKGTMEMKMIYCKWCTHMFLKVWSLLWIS